MSRAKPRKRDPKKDAAIREFIGKESVDRIRVAYQGYRPEKNRYFYDKKRKKSLIVSNAEHRARLAVAGGTIKALTTTALPEQPSLSWIYKTDLNTRNDDDEREAREQAARGAMAAAQIIEERGALPAIGARKPSLADTEDAPDHSADRADVTARPVDLDDAEGQHAETASKFWYPPTLPPMVQLPSPDKAYMDALDALERATDSFDARRQLETLRQRGQVSDQDFGFVKGKLVKGMSWRDLARISRGSNGYRLSYETVRQQTGAAIDAMVAAASNGFDAGLLGLMFRAGYSHE